MTHDTRELYRERDDLTRDRELADTQAVAEPGAEHAGETSVEGLDAVLNSGDRGVDWGRASEQSGLDRWSGFQSGGEV